MLPRKVTSKRTILLTFETFSGLSLRRTAHCLATPHEYGGDGCVGAGWTLSLEQPVCLCVHIVCLGLYTSMSLCAFWYVYVCTHTHTTTRTNTYTSTNTQIHTRNRLLALALRQLYTCTVLALGLIGTTIKYSRAALDFSYGYGRFET